LTGFVHKAPFQLDAKSQSYPIHKRKIRSDQRGIENGAIAPASLSERLDVGLPAPRATTLDYVVAAAAG
jgi:hypothetical protein